MNDVGIKGKVPKVIHKLELKEKDKSKQTKIKDAFAKGAIPKTISLPDVPRVTEKAPKPENNSSEEVVVERDWAQIWKDLEKDQIIARIQKEFTRHKKESTLERIEN